MVDASENTRLDGLQQIARHFGWGSPTTVRKYYRQHGLPLRSMGKDIEKPRYYAWTAELDKWRGEQSASGQHLEQPSNEEASQRVVRHSGRSWVGLIGLVAVGAAATVSMFARGDQSPPIAIARVENDGFVTGASETGIVVFKMHGDWGEVGPGTWSRDRPATLVRDFDRDGRPEVLFDYRPLDEMRESGALFLIDGDGSVVWSFQHGRDWPNDDRIKPAFSGRLMRLVDTPTGPLVVAGSSHRDLYPDRVVLLQPSDGVLVGEYLHPGRISSVDLQDIDQDGYPELIAGGVNNPFEGLGVPVVVILDLPFGPPKEHGTNFIEASNTLELAYLAFEPVEMYSQAEVSTVVKSVDASGESLVVIIGGEGRQSSHRIELSLQDYSVLSQSLTDSYLRSLMLAGSVANKDRAKVIRDHYVRVLVLPTAPDGNGPLF